MIQKRVLFYTLIFDIDTLYTGSYGEVPAQNTSDDSAEDTRKESGYGGDQDMDTEIGA